MRFADDQCSYDTEARSSDDKIQSSKWINSAGDVTPSHLTPPSLRPVSVRSLTLRKLRSPSGSVGIHDRYSQRSVQLDDKACIGGAIDSGRVAMCVLRRLGDVQISVFFQLAISPRNLANSPVTKETAVGFRVMCCLIFCQLQVFSVVSYQLVFLVSLLVYLTGSFCVKH